MLDQYYLENMEQFKAIADPVRWQMLTLLISKPMSGSQLAKVLAIPRSRAHYHLGILLKAGLIELVEERACKGILEKFYLSVARVFFMNHISSEKCRKTMINASPSEKSQTKINFLLAVIEQARSDILNANERALSDELRFNDQHAVSLTPEQQEIVMDEFRKVRDLYMKFNQENSRKSDRDGLLHIRYTLIQTPVGTFPDTHSTKSEGM